MSQSYVIIYHHGLQAFAPLRRWVAYSGAPKEGKIDTRLKLSDVGLLEKVGETGEIKSTTWGEAKESYSLDTDATQFAISRKALINDDLGAFRD